MRQLEVDARGQRCPLPVIRLARAAMELERAPDDTHDAVQVTVLATDPAARHDIPAWCRMRGHAPPQVHEHGDHTAYIVLVAAQPGSASGS